MLDELRVLQLPCRDVHRHLDVAAVGRPQARAVQARLHQHPAPDRHDQPGLFRERDEVERQHLAVLRMLPAEQRLVADDLDVLQVDDRLVVERELLSLDGPAEIGEPPRALERRVIERSVEECIVELRLRLRAVHRRIRLLQHCVRIEAERDPDAGVHTKVASFDLDRLCHARNEPLRDACRDIRLRDAGEHDRELVAAEPRSGVAGPDQRLDAPTEHGEHRIADRMAPLVVDLLEVVEVDEEERALLAGLLSHRGGLLQLLLEEDAVGEPGQRVVERLLSELLLRLALRGDVEQVALEVERLALVAVDDDAFVADPDDTAVAREQPVLHAERFVCRVRPGVSGQDAVAIVVMQRAHEEQRVVQPLVDRIAEQRLDLLAREEVRAIGV
jgi:hypothetical protein